MLSGQVEPIPAAAAALGAAQEHAREAGSSLGSDAEEATSSEARPCQALQRWLKMEACSTNQTCTGCTTRSAVAFISAGTCVGSADAHVMQGPDSLTVFCMRISVPAAFAELGSLWRKVANVHAGKHPRYQMVFVSQVASS